jgi:hypothetical protein
MSINISDESYDDIEKSTVARQSKLVSIDEATTGSLSGYIIKSDKTTASGFTAPAHSKSSSNPYMVTAKLAQRDLIKRTLNNIEELLSQMVEHAENNDLIELGIAENQIKTLLGELWDARQARELDWGDLVNLIRCVVTDEDFELWKTKKLHGFKEIVVNYLRLDQVNMHDIRECIALLRKIDIDPWKGISDR